MTTRLRALFVAPVEPWCRENGSSLITADLLEALAGARDVDLLPIFVRRPPEGYRRDPPPGLDGILLDVPGLPRWVSVLRAASRRSSPLRHRFDNGHVARRIRAVLSERGFEPDLVHVEHLPLVDIGLEVSRGIGRPLVYRAHNIESQLWARRLGAPAFLKDRIVAHMGRVEADAIRSSHLTLCISSGDLAWARAKAPDARSELLPCSLCVHRYDQIRSEATGVDPESLAVDPAAPGMDPQVCFVGGLDWAPNEDGLRWFVVEVLPRLTSRIPNVHLAVLARGADARSWLTSNPSVRLVAPESSAPELYASSDVSIAPLFQGGGVRIKIPESLALGCPVVATLVGAEGHDLPGITRTDEPTVFAEACLRHLEPGRSAEPRAALRAAVEARYGARTVAERLVELWSQTISTWEPGRSRRGPRRQSVPPQERSFPSAT